MKQLFQTLDSKQHTVVVPERRQVSPTVAPAFSLQILCGLQHKEGEGT